MTTRTATKGVLLAGSMLLGAASADAAEFGNFYAFGDSLTDCCAIGRYTDNNSPNWADLLPPLIGANYTATSRTNFAVGGAQSGYGNVAPATDQGFGAPTGFLSQVGRFEAQGVAVSPRDVAGIWVGTNDIWPSTSPAGSLPSWAQAPLGAQPGVPTLANHVVGNVRAGIQSLVNDGFRNIVLLSPYDLAQSTSVDAARGLGTQYSVAVRDGLGGLSTPGTNTYFLDTLGLLQQVQANAAAYGFEHLTGVDACQSSDCIFTDGIHLTGAFHQVIAASLAGIISPGQVAPAVGTTPASEIPLAVEASPPGEALSLGEAVPVLETVPVFETASLLETVSGATAVFAAPVTLPDAASPASVPEVPEAASLILVAMGLGGLVLVRGARGGAA